jgi:hypothetical protein
VESRAEGETGCPQGSNEAKRSGNMQVSPPNRANPEGSVLYRSGLNPKIQRNPSTSLGTLSLSKGFEVFTPCDFIAAITQHPPSLKLRRAG